MPTEAQRQADEHYVAVAKRHGVREGVSRLVIKWCREYNLPISLGFALGTQESHHQNVFGHDPTICIGWGTVTRAKYLIYRTRRRRSGNKLMQGIGWGQLTWWETQDLADRLGGCHKSEANIRVAIMTLAARIRDFGYVKGIERYNGTGPAAVRYSREVRALADVWHRRLAA
jgi:hypothetical protein